MASRSPHTWHGERRRNEHGQWPKDWHPNLDRQRLREALIDAEAEADLLDALEGVAA